MVKKMFVLLMAVVMLIGASQNVLADELVENADMRFEKTDVFYIEVEVISEDGVRTTGLLSSVVLSLSSPTEETLRVYVQIEATETMQKLGFSEMKLQRKTSPITWTTVYNYGSSYDSSTDIFAYSATTRGLTSGSYYRLSCTAYAQKSETKSQSTTKHGSWVECR